MLWRKRHMGDTASLGLSMARTSEACAAVVILVWRCQFTLRGVCMHVLAGLGTQYFLHAGVEERGATGIFCSPPTETVLCGKRLEHSCLDQDV